MHKMQSSLLLWGLVAIALTSAIQRADSSPEVKSPEQVAAIKPDIPDTPATKAELSQKSLVAAEAPVAAAPSGPAPSNSAEAVAAVDSSAKLKPADDEPSKRKARSDTAQAEPAKTTSADQSKASPEKAAEPSKSDQSTKSKQESGDSKSTAKPKTASTSSQKASTKSKLPANLGTVTSTGNGNGGSAHYMSKHDAYSAIAEKHGAIAHDAMRKSDRHKSTSSSSSLHRFGGIQKASGIADSLNPFRGVTDSGLARTLGASMRSIMKSKYSVPAYVASALLGAVALMAFYESPISPLPVPPLPEPPVGRFPPEMPNIPVGTQVPYRANQQANYQRMMPSAMNMNVQASQPQAQVLFPTNPQQRSGQVSNLQGSSAAQLAANLLGKQQVAQRKSGPDYEGSLTRSLFGSISAPANVPSVANPSAKSAGLIQPQIGQRSSSSILGIFGLGGSEPQPASSGPSSTIYSNSLSESKSQQSSIVNKVKSYFTRSSSAPSSQPSPPSPSDPYQRMSFMQALIKETNFLPGFLSSNRKLSTAAVQPASGVAAGASKPASTSNSVAAPSSPQQGPAARMQVDSHMVMQPGPSTKSKQTSSGYGLVRAADRIAHALLETFTSGVAQRSALTSGSNSPLDGQQQKSSSAVDEATQSQQSSLASATSFINDIMSSYNAANSEQQQSQSSPVSHNQADKSQAQAAVQLEAQANGRATDASAFLVVDDNQQQQYHNTEQQQQHHHHPQQQQQQVQPQPKSSDNQKQQVINSNTQPNAVHSSGEPTTGKVRKTRSIGIEYPIESGQELSQKQPSRATQINNVIDYVTDSYAQNRLLINLIMNQVGLSQAVPYMEQILGPAGASHRS